MQWVTNYLSIFVWSFITKNRDFRLSFLSYFYSNLTAKIWNKKNTSIRRM